VQNGCLATDRISLTGSALFMAASSVLLLLG
jgi:hypothetical protein